MAATPFREVIANLMALTARCVTPTEILADRRRRRPRLLDHDGAAKEKPIRILCARIKFRRATAPRFHRHGRQTAGPVNLVSATATGSISARGAHDLRSPASQ